MKKILTAFFSLVVITAGAQTAEQVITKYAAAMGGLDAYEKIKSAKLTGTFSSQGNDFPLTMQINTNKSMRVDIDVMGQTVINVYHKEAGWQVNPFIGIETPADVTGSELIDLKAQTNLANNLMDYKKRGHQVNLEGEETVDGIATYKIKLTSKDDGRVTYYYINKTDNLLLKSATTRETQGTKAEIETYYSDVKDFNGIKFPMTRSQKMNGTEVQSTTFSSFELNVPVDEKIFNK